MELRWSPKRKYKRYLPSVEKCQRPQKEEMGKHMGRGSNSGGEKKIKEADRYEIVFLRGLKRKCILSCITKWKSMGRWELSAAPRIVSGLLWSCCSFWDIPLYLLLPVFVVAVGTRESTSVPWVQGFQQHVDT